MNVATILDAHPASAVALIDGDRRRTYGELRAEIAAARSGLAARGVRFGDRVALLATNTIETVVGYFAVVGLGAIAVPLNPLAPVAELSAQLEAVGAGLLLVDGAPTPLAVQFDAGLTVVAVAQTQTGDVPFAADMRVVDPHDVALLVFTSGTAGAPRAAMLTHGNLLANLHQSVPLGAVTSNDVVLGLLPLHHIFGLNVALTLALFAGASVVLATGFDPVGTLELIGEHAVTIVPGAPPIWVAWSVHPAADLAAFNSVRLALSGAAHLPEDVARRFVERTHVDIREGYGLTEASPVVTTSMIGPPRIGSIGRVVPGVTIRLVDSEGDDALSGDPGEIWVHGPNVFPGYWQDPEATARALTSDGWLRTGDIAVVDEDGFLYLVDRSKDLIIVSGFNVYPAEVEDVIAQHPAVAAVAVVGVPHAATGEAVKAFVVVKPGAAVTEAEIAAHCRTLLARYKCPATTTFVDSIPTGPNGKVLRRALR